MNHPFTSSVLIFILTLDVKILAFTLEAVVVVLAMDGPFSRSVCASLTIYAFISRCSAKYNQFHFQKEKISCTRNVFSVFFFFFLEYLYEIDKLFQNDDKQDHDPFPLFFLIFF